MTIVDTWIAAPSSFREARRERTELPKHQPASPIAEDDFTDGGVPSSPIVLRPLRPLSASGHRRRIGLDGLEHRDREDDSAASRKTVFLRVQFFAGKHAANEGSLAR
jgi:hypothetical protein